MHSEKTHKQTLTGKWRRRVHAQHPTHIPRRNGHGPNANRVPPTNEILTMYHPRARPQLSQKDALRESSLVAPIRPTDDLLCGPKAYAPVRESFKRELKKSPPATTGSSSNRGSHTECYHRGCIVFECINKHQTRPLPLLLHRPKKHSNGSHPTPNNPTKTDGCANNQQMDREIAWPDYGTFSRFCRLALRATFFIEPINLKDDFDDETSPEHVSVG